MSIGLPFFALAANSPLLQAWFARSDHPAAKDPYFLYAASNVGSFLALLSYPLIIEPLIRLYDQTWLWTIGFYVLILLIVGTGYLLRNWLDVPASRSASGVTGTAPTSAPTSAPTWRDALTWVGLAAVPSGLLIAVTAHISTDVAAVPLLWVIPLALYLLTFVIVFASRPLIPHNLLVAIQPIFIIALVAVMIFEPVKMIVGVIAIHIGIFFVLHAGLPWRACPAKARTAAPDRVLYVDVRRRHDWRDRVRPDRTLHIQLDRRISDPDRACGAVPAGPGAAEVLCRADHLLRRACGRGPRTGAVPRLRGRGRLPTSTTG